MSVYGGNFFQNGANNPIREQAEAGGRLPLLPHFGGKEALHCAKVCVGISV